jgi:hypothetical protein
MRGQLRWLQVDVAGTINDKTIIEGNIDGNWSPTSRSN